MMLMMGRPIPHLLLRVSCPDISFTVNFCAQYMFNTKIYHELELNMLAIYLKLTQENGLVLDPNYDIFKVDIYPDDGFSGMCGHKNPDDQACAKICTAFIITISDCTVLWNSKFKTETNLSTMESETIAISHCCRP